jgi:hypothetical protein
MATAQAVNQQIIVPQNGEVGRRGEVICPIFWAGVGCVADDGRAHLYFENVLQAKELQTRFWQVWQAKTQSTKGGAGGASRDQNGAFAVERMDETAAHGQ